MNLADGPPLSPLGLAFDPATSTRRGAMLDVLRATLRQALTLGVTVVDVAADDDAVAEVAIAVRDVGRRDRITIATRIPPAVAPVDTLRARMQPGYVVARIEATLRHTRLDAIPLVQLASVRATWLEDRAWPELAGTLARLRDEGKLLAWGVSLDDLATPPPIIIGQRPPPAPTGPYDTAAALAPLLTAADLATLAVPYHLWHRLAAPLAATLAAAATAEPKAPRVALLARAPLGRGALGGDLAPGVRLAVRDDRLGTLTPPRLAAIALALAPLAALVRDPPPAVRGGEAATAYARALPGRPPHLPCHTVAELALRWLLSQPGVTTALPLLSSPAHLEAAVIAAAAPPLPPDLLDLLSPNAIPPP
jgi:aryl-alcohol dehydrogenase-like predicted oxidoreductase